MESFLLKLRLLLRRRKRKRQLHLNKLAQQLIALKDQVQEERCKPKALNSKLRYPFLFFHKMKLQRLLLPPCYNLMKMSQNLEKGLYLFLIQKTPNKNQQFLLKLLICLRKFENKASLLMILQKSVQFKVCFLSKMQRLLCKNLLQKSFQTKV